MDKQELEELLQEAAETELLSKLRNQRFNQPNLITISSVNRSEDPQDDTPYSDTAFSSFQINLPRPALDVKGLQLLSTNIPQCNANIANTACAFWYYRMSANRGMIPNINNLYYVRLLPSFYKKEYIDNSALYGYNQTFNNYVAVSTQLAKACANDLLFGRPPRAEYYVPYLPNDVSISYDAGTNKFQMTGLNTSYSYLLWDVGTNYTQNQVVYTADEVGRRTWELLIPSCTGVNPREPTLIEWSGATLYAPGNCVLYGGLKYYVGVENLNLAPGSTPAEWTFANYYVIGNCVSYSGATYRCISDDPESSYPPPENPNWVVFTGNVWTAFTGNIWKQVYVEIINEWNLSAPYTEGLIVSYNGQLYQADTSSTGEQPDTSTSWNEYTPGQAYTYLITGYDDPNVQKLQGDLFELEWNEYTVYNPDEVVSFQGAYFKATYQNVNVSPIIQSATPWEAGDTYYKGQYVYDGLGGAYVSLQDDNTNNEPAGSPYWWKYLGVYGTWSEFTSPIKSGLYGMTKEYDMMEDDTIDGTPYRFINFPYGVGGQPFNPNPKRILNTILGFTWNGRFTPTEYSNLGESQTIIILQNKRFPQLYNRLRPVPNYGVRLLGETELGAVDPSASVSLTYTADSYANLVYSSIINIYANVVGGSTIDTQRQSGLLAITSINCGNLGVAFWDNYVDNPLMKVNGDIYGMTINFTDEYGEPYYLSNNAVATLVFKVSYENKITQVSI